MKTAIFLGAGASAAEGAPIQTHLFRDYFTLINTRYSSGVARMKHEKELIRFFRLVFDIAINKYSNLNIVKFPTFEEAIGMLDLADIKNESFKDIADGIQIKYLRLYLVFLMTDIINENLKKSKGFHQKLVRELYDIGMISDVVFLTTNYDILCDNAVLDLYPDKRVDYGVDFINFYEKGGFLRPNEGSINLFKLHGSLNWLHCPTCNNVRITPYEKSVYKLIASLDKAKCPRCQTVYSPIIVPPTFYKDFSKVFLNQVWNKAEQELLNVEHLIFCGYSFPDADMHIKYLIKRIQKNRTTALKLKVTVINNHEGKRSEIADEERSRYIRFLGNDVNYTDYSFEEFVNNHSRVI